MVKYVVYNDKGKILRYGVCQKKDVQLQAIPGQKIKIVKNAFRGMDRVKKIIDGVVVNLPSNEIKEEEPLISEPVSIENRTARITNEQWQDVLKRLNNLESK